MALFEIGRGSLGKALRTFLWAGPIAQPRRIAFHHEPPMGADGVVFVQRQDHLYFGKMSACQRVEFQADIKIMMKMDYVRLCPVQYARKCFDYLFRFL